MPRPSVSGRSRSNTSFPPLEELVEELEDEAAQLDALEPPFVRRPPARSSSSRSPRKPYSADAGFLYDTPSLFAEAHDDDITHFDELATRRAAQRSTRALPAREKPVRE